MKALRHIITAIAVVAFLGAILCGASLADAGFDGRNLKIFLACVIYLALFGVLVSVRRWEA